MGGQAQLNQLPSQRAQTGAASKHAAWLYAADRAANGGRESDKVEAHRTLATLRDANRAQVCNDAANRLLSDGSARINLILGFRLGERLAWPSARFAHLREELDAMRAVQGEPMKLLSGDAKLTTDSAFFSCSPCIHCDSSY